MHTAYRRSRQAYFLLLGAGLVAGYMIVPLALPEPGPTRRDSWCPTPEMRRAKAVAPGAIPVAPPDQAVVNRLLDIQAKLDGVAGAEEARQMAFELAEDIEGRGR